LGESIHLTKPKSHVAGDPRLGKGRAYREVKPVPSVSAETRQAHFLLRLNTKGNSAQIGNRK
jgi:hypothetical protein